MLPIAGARGQQVRVVLAIGDKDFFCDGTGAYMYSVPFLSVGAQDQRGNPGPVGYISKTGSAHGEIAFRAGLSSYQMFGCKPGTQSICSPSGTGVHAGVYALAHWGGIAHLVFIDLFGQGVQDYSMYPPGESKWNWPVQDSFFYPGAEILSFVAGDQLSEYCGIDLPRYTTDFEQRRYRIDFGKIFGCAETLGRLAQPMPDTTIALDGIHWYVEGVGTSGNLGFAFSHPETALFVAGFE
ncbi:MAG: hypothetical protein WBV61_03020 [Rhodanobacteraceae bacterium]